MKYWCIYLAINFFMCDSCTDNVQYTYAPHDDVSVNDIPHI